MRIVITYRSEGRNEYIPLMEAAFASAKKLGYETVLVGDDVTPCDHHIDLKGPPHLMDWILRAQWSYISSNLFDCNSVFFSPDALIVKPLEPVFEKDFDLAVTVREHEKYPVNNGVIYIKPECKHAMAMFWTDVRIRCDNYEENIRRWGGDQLALHEELAAHGDEPRGMKALRLPCDTYNASTEQMKPADIIRLRDAYVVHFKGARKSAMLGYWKDLAA